MVDKKEECLQTVQSNEKVFLDFIDYLFPYLDRPIQAGILSRYLEWLDDE